MCVADDCACASTSALAGIRVAITRPQHRALDLANALGLHGATVAFCPLIASAPPLSYAALDACIARLESYTWLAFTSATAVESISDRMMAHGALPVAAGTTRALIAVVGNATAQSAIHHFGRVDHVGHGNARSLATSMPMQSGNRILFVCSDRARDVLPAVLASRGAQVDRVVGYQTSLLDDSASASRFRDANPDVVIVHSPSAVAALVALGHAHDLAIPHIICVGRTTAASAREAGLHVAAVATAPSDEAVLRATVRFVSGLRENNRRAGV